MTSKLRQNALIKIEPNYKKWLKENDGESPLLKEDVFIFLGEIPNMPNHSIVAGHKSGKILSGYHTSDFMELSDDEV